MEWRRAGADDRRARGELGKSRLAARSTAQPLALRVGNKRHATAAPERLAGAHALRARKHPIGYNFPFSQSQKRSTWKRNVSTRSKPLWPTCAVARASYGGIFDYDAQSPASRSKSTGNSKTRTSGTTRSTPRPSAGKRSCSTTSSASSRRSITICATRRICSTWPAKKTTRKPSSPAKPMRRGSKSASPTWNSAGCSRIRPTRTTAFLDIQAGAGGTEACDWAAMLLRQYLRYCERKGFKTEVLEEIRRRRRGHQERDHQDRRRIRVRLSAHRNRRAPPRAQVAVRFVGRAPYVVFVGVRVPGNRRFDRSRHQPGRSAHRHVSRVRRGRPAHQQDRLRRAHHAHADRASSCSARTTARSTVTAPKPWRC